MSQEMEPQEKSSPVNGGRGPRSAPGPGNGRREQLPPEVATVRDMLRNLSPKHQELLHREMGWVVLHRGWNDRLGERQIEYVLYNKTYEPLYRNITFAFQASAEFLQRMSTGRIPFTEERREIMAMITVEGYDENGDSIAPAMFRPFMDELAEVRKTLDTATRDMRKAVPNKWLIQQQRRKEEKKEAQAADSAPEISNAENAEEADPADNMNSAADQAAVSPAEEAELANEQDDAAPRRGKRPRASSASESSETMPAAEMTDSGIPASAEE